MKKKLIYIALSCVLVLSGVAEFVPARAREEAKIAFQTSRDKGKLDVLWGMRIYVMGADGKNQRQITDNPATDSSPDWSPNGKSIVFYSERDGNSEIYVMDADGKNQRQITDNPAKDRDPDWSPNGKSIVFHSKRDGNEEIYVMDVDGKNQRRLTDDPAKDESPAWSPDGKSIAFHSKRDGNYEIYVMDADGKKQRRLAAVPGSDKNPAWFDRAGYPVSPGGKLRATWGWLKQKIE